MKNTRKCPKCGGNEVLHIDGTKAALLKIKVGISANATVSLYVCGTCGYCESWVDSKVDLSDLKKLYPPKPAP